MKVTLSTILLLGASVSSALAVADANADPKRKGGHTGWCSVPGGACKRDAAAEAKPNPRGLHTGWCGVPGASCMRLKRTADAVIEALNEPYLEKPGFSFCDVGDEACAKAAEQLLKVGETGEGAFEEGIVAREARKGGSTGWCGVPGASCKRDASAEPEAKRKSGHTGWCGVPGASCKMVRDANADPQRKGGSTGWCGVPGGACKRDAEPKRKDLHTGWCGVPGASCKSKRDLDTITNAVRAAKEWSPEAVRAPCYAKGGECKAILNAHAKFHQVKREAEAIRHLDNNAKKAYCKTHDCDQDAHYALRAPADLSRRSEEACYGEDGDCTVAERGLEELERSLNEAVASLDEE